MKKVVTLSISILLVFAIPVISPAQTAAGDFTFEWQNIPLRAALDSVMRLYSIPIVFLDEDVEGRSVSASCKECSFEKAMNSILSNSALVWIKLGNQIILKRQTFDQSVQRFTISGTVIDSISGENISGARIQLMDSSGAAFSTVRRWCLSNEFGFFSIPRVENKKCDLVIKAIGFDPVVIGIDNLSATPLRLNIRMVQKDIVMKDVTVQGNRIGFASAMGFSRGVYHKSALSDHNQYLLDGTMIYNPVHFGGVINTLNPEVINDVQIALDGLPPSYGGRLGGIIDFSLRDGLPRYISGSIGTGFLSSNLSFDGPIDENTSFIVSGRKGYPSLAVKTFSYKNVNPNQQGFSELVAKITRKLSNSSRLSLSGYFGNDYYKNEASGEAEKLENNFSWRNGMLNLRWISILNPSLFVYATAAYTYYDFNLEHMLNGSAYYNGTRLSSDYRIEDYSFRAQAEGFYSEDHTVLAGVELIQHKINGYVSQFSSLIAPYSLSDFISLESAVYIQDQWKFAPFVQAEIGGRATSFSSDNGSFSSMDPRFSLLVTLSERTRIYGSIAAVNQFIHPYRNSGIFLIYPVIFLYPSTARMQPTNSTHVRLGLERSIRDDEYVFSVEAYYKKMNNLHEFGFDTVSPGATNVLDDMALLGGGKAYGLTINLKKRAGNLTGGVTYNYAHFLEKFENINGGNEFSPPFDRRHEVQLSLSYLINSAWMINALCMVSSENSYINLPQVYVQNPTYGRGEGAGTGISGSASLSYNEFIDVNGGSLPGFQRLEVSIGRKFFIWSMPSSFTLRLMNGYGLLDQYKWRLPQISPVGLKWDATIQKQDLFPLYPSLEFSIRF